MSNSDSNDSNNENKTIKQRLQENAPNIIKATAVTTLLADTVSVFFSTLIFFSFFARTNDISEQNDTFEISDALPFLSSSAAWIGTLIGLALLSRKEPAAKIAGIVSLTLAAGGNLITVFSALNNGLDYDASTAEELTNGTISIAALISVTTKTLLSAIAAATAKLPKDEEMQSSRNDKSLG